MKEHFTNDCQICPFWRDGSDPIQGSGCAAPFPIDSCPFYAEEEAKRRQGVKKNRFYYSEKQAEVERLCDQFFAYVTLPSGEEVRYTEWCSSPESVCSWDDAVLVYESDEMPRVVTEPNADYCEEEPPFWEEGYDEYEADLDADFLFDKYWDEGPDIGSFYDPRNNPEED